MAEQELAVMLSVEIMFQCFRATMYVCIVEEENAGTLVASRRPSGVATWWLRLDVLSTAQRYIGHMQHVT